MGVDYRASYGIGCKVQVDRPEDFYEDVEYLEHLLAGSDFEYFQ